MRKYLLLSSLWIVFACTDSSPEEGGDDAMQKAAPEVWIEAGQGLPKEESSANSLAITVSGNETATAYQYALFSDTNVTCGDAKYGAFKSISTKLTETDLGNNGTKIICLRGKDKEGNVQAVPKRYSWTKVDGAAVGDQLPEVELETIPTANMLSINSKVVGNKITEKYQYVLVNAAKYNCDGVEDDANVSYGAVRKITEMLVEDVGVDGHKTLCLRGLDKDGKLQTKATSYHWEKTPSVTNSNNEKPAEGQPGIGLISASITFRSGSGSAYGITVRNVGTGKLKWQAKTASSSTWLQVKDAKGNYVPLKAGELASGELAPDESKFVFFRLAKGRDTDYGKPYKREHEVVFVNKESKYQMKAKIALEIPKLDNSDAAVALTRTSAPIKVYVKNLNKPLGLKYLMNIEVVPAFPTTITKAQKIAQDKKFKSMVTHKIGVETTGSNVGDNYVEFTVKPAGVTGCDIHQQTILVYSNGDSKGANDCTVDAWTKYIGGNGKGANWTTRRCKRIVVTFNTWKHLDLNNDNKVNVQDLVAAASYINTAPPSPMTDAYQRADVDGNGKVEQADLVAIRECL